MSLLTSYVTPLSVPASQGIRSWTTFWAQPHSLVHKSSAERPTFQSGLGPNIVRKDMMWRVRSTENSAEGAARLGKTVRMTPMNQSSWWVSQVTSGNFLKNCGPQLCAHIVCLWSSTCSTLNDHWWWRSFMFPSDQPWKTRTSFWYPSKKSGLANRNNSLAHNRYPDQVFWTWSVSFSFGYRSQFDTVWCQAII